MGNQKDFAGWTLRITVPGEYIPGDEVRLKDFPDLWFYHIKRDNTLGPNIASFIGSSAKSNDAINTEQMLGLCAWARSVGAKVKVV